MSEKNRSASRASAGGQVHKKHCEAFEIGFLLLLQCMTSGLSVFGCSTSRLVRTPLCDVSVLRHDGPVFDRIVITSGPVRVPLYDFRPGQGFTV